MYDLIIKNGKIIDGTAGPYYRSDIAIKDGKIAKIAKNLTDAEKIIDAKGLTVTPGFIDSHSHSDSSLLTYPDLKEKIEQGITTSVAGLCGDSPAPISRDIDPEKARVIEGFGKVTDIYKTMGTFLNLAKEQSYGSNTICLVGHGQLRKAVMGMEKREPANEEMEKMKELLRDGMEHGALGMSMGLIYPPGSYSKMEELVELSKIVAEYGGVIAAHIRDEGAQLIEATEEFIEIIKLSGVRGVHSHHKTSGHRENWGKVSHSLRLIDKANEEGTEIYCDVYPYIATHTSASVRFVPDSGQNLLERLKDESERAKMKEWGRAKWGDDLSWAQVTRCTAYPQYEGLRIPEIAKLHGKDVYDTIYDMILESSNACSCCYFTMCEEDVETVMAHPRAMICTDSGVAETRKVYHPRMRGTFPRALGRYVRERGVTTLPEMIRKMTSMPAAVYNLQTKGLIREGMDADICIFDAEKIIDRSEYTNCTAGAEGLNYVILGGEVVCENAVFNGKRNGKLILREGNL